jgi:hypothetical protein
VYVVATCLASVLRRQETIDAYGDPTGQYIPVVTGIPAAIMESGNTVQDYSSQTPRTIRAIDGTFPAGTDVRVNDRVSDDTHGVVYVVVNVTATRAPGHQPDLQVTLKKVT